MRTPRERFVFWLGRTRALLEGMLADFTTPERWTFQLYEGANHALWIAGHLAFVDNAFVSLINPSKAIDLSAWAPIFGPGSQAVSNIEAYPPVDEVLTQLRERRAALVEAYLAATDEELNGPLPPGFPLPMEVVGEVANVAPSHESIHAGQLSMIRRHFGHQPVLPIPKRNPT
jgi:hypothetical protein